MQEHETCHHVLIFLLLMWSSTFLTGTSSVLCASSSTRTGAFGATVVICSSRLGPRLGVSAQCEHCVWPSIITSGLGLRQQRQRRRKAVIYIYIEYLGHPWISMDWAMDIYGYPGWEIYPSANHSKSKPKKSICSTCSSVQVRNLRLAEASRHQAIESFGHCLSDGLHHCISLSEKSPFLQG